MLLCLKLCSIKTSGTLQLYQLNPGLLRCPRKDENNVATIANFFLTGTLQLYQLNPGLLRLRSRKDNNCETT